MKTACFKALYRVNFLLAYSLSALQLETLRTAQSALKSKNPPTHSDRWTFKRFPFNVPPFVLIRSVSCHNLYYLCVGFVPQPPTLSRHQYLTLIINSFKDLLLPQSWTWLRLNQNPLLGKPFSLTQRYYTIYWFFVPYNLNKVKNN